MEEGRVPVDAGPSPAMHLLLPFNSDGEMDDSGRKISAKKRNKTKTNAQKKIQKQKSKGPTPAPADRVSGSYDLLLYGVIANC